MNLKQLVVMSAVAVATGCTSSQQHTSTPFDEYPVCEGEWVEMAYTCLLYTSPSPRDVEESRMPSSA